MHLFFHGQNGQGGAPNFDLWKDTFLEPFNLIGINMQYQDGDNSKDTRGKVLAAREAIAQTLADYKIIPGHGVICSFSGGGGPHGLFTERLAHERGPNWPFAHSAMYSSNYWTVITLKMTPMSWFGEVGGKEWGMAQPKLGQSAVQRITELKMNAAKGGPCDIYFASDKDGGHGIRRDEVFLSAKQFRRSTLAYAPVLYEADFLEPELASLVKTANALALGQPVTAVDKILNDKKATAPVLEKAAAIKAFLTARIEDILKIAKELESDPVLMTYYGPLYARQLAGTPQAKQLQESMAAADKNPQRAKVMALFMKFKLLDVFVKYAYPPAESSLPMLQDLQKSAGDNSALGQMAAGLIKLRN